MSRSAAALLMALALAACGWAAAVPSWATAVTRTEHFVYHHAPSDLPDPDALRAMEAHYAFIEATFGVSLPRGVRYVKYPSLFAFMYAHPGFRGWATPGCIESPYWFHPHEGVHTVIWPECELLREGIAEAFGTPVEDGWSRAPECDAIRYESIAAGLACFRNLHRPLARHLVRWLYCRYGKDKLLQLLSVRTARPREVEAAFKSCYGRDLRALVEQCRADYDWLRAQPPPEGFFHRSLK